MVIITIEKKKVIVHSGTALLICRNKFVFFIIAIITLNQVHLYTRKRESSGKGVINTSDNDA